MTNAVGNGDTVRTGPATRFDLPVHDPPLMVGSTLPRRTLVSTLECVTPLTRRDETDRLLGSLIGRRPFYVCVAAHTDTSSIPGISAAGASQEMIPFTPAADLEALAFGRPRCLDTIPSNPLGPPGPALVTRTALAAGAMCWLPIVLGLRVQPDLRVLTLASTPGGRIDLEDGVPNAKRLFEQGLALGDRLASRGDYLVIGESVPGGTTTSLAVLRQLGLPHRVSGSGAADVAGLKQAVATRASARAALATTASTLDVVAALGDPMQPLVAGLILSALPRLPVVLAGGTQMAAVLAIVDRLAHERREQLERNRLVLATTPWVARDPSADLIGILEGTGGWCAAAPRLDFAAMEFEPLRHYERYLVKEGVGAGGTALAALLTGRITLDGLHRAIDATYRHYLSDLAHG